MYCYNLGDLYITSTGTCTILGMFLKAIQCNPCLSVTHSTKNTEIVINMFYFAHSSMFIVYKS